jgi:hypothetical protein
MMVFLFNQHLKHLGMIYEVTLHRVVEHETIYIVDADDPEEAEEMVLSGNYDEVIEDSEQGEMEDPEVVDVVEQVAV